MTSHLAAVLLTIHGRALLSYVDAFQEIKKNVTDAGIEPAIS